VVGHSTRTSGAIHGHPEMKAKLPGSEIISQFMQLQLSQAGQVLEIIIKKYQ
jgi:hypothetical protein